MGFIKRIKYVDTSTGLDVSKQGHHHDPIFSDKYRGKTIYCNRGHRVKRKGATKGFVALEGRNLSEQHFFCKVCGILNENQVHSIG